MAFYPRVLTTMPEVSRLVVAEPCPLILYVDADHDLRHLVRNSDKAVELAHQHLSLIPVFPVPDDVCHILAFLWQQAPETPVMIDCWIHSALETYNRSCTPMLWKPLTFSLGALAGEEDGVGCRLTEIVVGREMEHFASFILPDRDIKACHHDYVTVGGGPVLPNGMSVPFPYMAGF